MSVTATADVPMRPCRARPCSTMVKAGEPLCARHWRQVPSETAAEYVRAINAYLEAPEHPHSVWFAAWKDYHRAVLHVEASVSVGVEDSRYIDAARKAFADGKRTPITDRETDTPINRLMYIRERWGLSLAQSKRVFYAVEKWAAERKS